MIACLPVLAVADLVYWRVLFGTRAGRRVDGIQLWWQRRSWPRTAEEAAERLYARLSPRERRMLNAPNNEIHWFSFGMGIRDEFGLWQGNDALIASCGLRGSVGPEANHASGVILDRLVRLVRSRQG